MLLFNKKNIQNSFMKKKNIWEELKIFKSDYKKKNI